jgi:hypothetical protein
MTAKLRRCSIPKNETWTLLDTNSPPPLRVYVTLHVHAVVEGPKLSIDFEWLATMAD